MTTHCPEFHCNLPANHLGSHQCANKKCAIYPPSDSVDPRKIIRLAEDVKQALLNWTDVPEYVDYRYSEAPNGAIIVSEYDDAMPGQVQARYELHITVREI